MYSTSVTTAACGLLVITTEQIDAICLVEYRIFGICVCHRMTITSGQ